MEEMQWNRWVMDGMDGPTSMEKKKRTSYLAATNITATQCITLHCTPFILIDAPLEYLQKFLGKPLIMAGGLFSFLFNL